jgi:hypothetical protein
MFSFADNHGRQAVSQRQSHSGNGSAFRYGTWLFIVCFWATLLAGEGDGGLVQAKSHPTTVTLKSRRGTLTVKGSKLSIPNVAWGNVVSSNGVMGVAKMTNHASSTIARPSALWMRIRGGADDEEEVVEGETVQEEEGGEEGDDDVENEEEEEEDEEGLGSLDVSEVIEKALSVSTRVLKVVGKITLQVIQTTSQAVQRAIQAGMSGDEEEEEVAGDEEEEVTIVVKIMRIAKRMIRAALTPPPTSDEDGDDEGTNDESDDTPVTKSTEDDGEENKGTDTSSDRGSDLGSFLSKVYGVTDDRDDSGPLVLGGTLTEALEVARSQARLLVVFLPSAKPPSSKKQQSSTQSADQEALTSILSQPVSQAAQKKARKSGTTTGSFVVWGAKFGSSEATMAIKRLKVKATIAAGSKKGSGKPPMLLVVYPNLVRR